MPRLILDGDARGAVRGVADLTREFEKTKTEVNLTTRATRDLEKAAAAIVSKNQGPQEKYNAQIRELAKLVKQGKLSFEEADRAALRYGLTLDKSSASARQLFGPNAIANLANYAAGLVGIGTAMAVVNEEFEAMREHGRKITQAQMTAADARDVLKRNIFGLPDASRDQILQRADRLSASTKLPQSIVDQAVAQTISSRSGNVNEAIKFVELAARFNRDPESIGEFAGALGDIANALGTNDPQRALGFLGITSQQGRPTDLRQVSRNLPKLVQAVRGAGGDPRYGGSLFAGITVGAADPQGEVSRTAGIRLTQKIGEFFKGDPRGYQKTQVDEFNEQIQVLMQDRKLARQFLDTYTFEAAAQPAIQSMLLDTKSAARRSFDSAYAALGTPSDQLTAGRRGVAFLSEGDLARTRRHEDTVRSVTERWYLGEDAEYSPERRQEISDLSRRVQGTFAWIHNKTFAMRTGPTLSREEAIDELEYALKMQPGRFSPLRDESAIGAAEQLLGELRDLAKEQRDAVKSMDRKTRSLPPPGGRQE